MHISENYHFWQHWFLPSPTSAPSTPTSTRTSVIWTVWASELKTTKFLKKISWNQKILLMKVICDKVWRVTGKTVFGFWLKFWNFWPNKVLREWNLVVLNGFQTKTKEFFKLNAWIFKRNDSNFPKIYKLFNCHCRFVTVLEFFLKS